MPSSASAPPVRAVLFDYGLVLTGPPHPPAWERMKQLLHTDEEAFHAAYWHWRADYDRGALNGQAYWRHVAGDLAQDLDERTLQQLLDADNMLWTQPNPPMIAWAAALQQAGVRTGILSNLGDEMERGVLQRCPWLGDFHHHTFSHRLHTAKPDPAIYQHAAAGLQIPSSEILFVDDRQENIEGARNAGMQAIQYVTHEDFERQLRAAGHGDLLFAATKV